MYIAHDADVCKITHVKVIINSTAIHVPLVVQVSALQEVCASKAEERLVNEAKKWATKAAKDYKITSHGERVRITPESKDTPQNKMVSLCFAIVMTVYFIFYWSSRRMPVSNLCFVKANQI